MHDLTQISQQDDRGNQLYPYSSHAANPAVRRAQSSDAADEEGKEAHRHMFVLSSGTRRLCWHPPGLNIKKEKDNICKEEV